MSVLAADQIPSTVPQYVKKTISSAQILDLKDTPVELVAAPGAGFALIPVHASFIVNAGATPYANAGNYLTISYVAGTPIASGLGCSVQNDILTGAVDQFAIADLSPGTSSRDLYGNLSDFDNKALILTATTADVTGGDGTMDVVVHYLVIPTA